MITEISPRDVISHCRSALGVKPGGTVIDDAFLAALLRHAAGMMCPCSRTALRAAIVESLSSLHELGDDLPSRLEDLTEELIVAGDLLELSDVTIGDAEVKGTWVFSSPPAFVERRSGSIFLIGIVPDHDVVLPEALSRRVVHSDNTRFIEPQPGEDLVGILAAEGLTQMVESVWLKAPKAQPASEHIGKLMQRMASEPPCTPISGIDIIDPDTKPTFYRGRWTVPSNQTGTFIARRPKEFGAPIWCAAELNEGVLVRVVDLLLGTYRWRACDAAWHLQMAIDRENGRPQRYRILGEGNARRFDFFSPLPLWAERRLMVFGRKCQGQRSLFSYEIPASEASQEEEFLQQNLWLARDEYDANDGRDA